MIIKGRRYRFVIHSTCRRRTALFWVTDAVRLPSGAFKTVSGRVDPLGQKR